MVKATTHYLIWAWQTLIDRRMYHPFIVIYLIISVYYRNLRCFNRWQLYILFNNVSYFGWSLANHWPRALFPILHDCRGLNCHFNLLTDILCELRYRRLCFIEKWSKYSIIIRYNTLLHRIGDNREAALNNRWTWIANRLNLPFVASQANKLQSKKSVSDGIWSTFVDSINVFDCHLSGMCIDTMNA